MHSKPANSPSKVNDRFERLLTEFSAETAEQRRDRAMGQFDRLAGALGSRIVLFGTGYLGRMVVGRMRQAGIEPVCFSDNNEQRWGTQVQGIEVLSPEDSVRRFGQTACFVVTIYNGSAARRQLREMGCARVLPITPMFWKYAREFTPDLGIDTPGHIVEQQEQIRRCFALLGDEESRQEFCEQLAWRYWSDPESLPTPANAGEIYFPDDLVSPMEEEVLVDCGAYDGDSVKSFVRRGRNFRHLYALEPDATNREKLQASVAALSPEIRQKVTPWPYAVGDKDEQIRFVETQNMGSRVSTSDQGTAIDSRRLDSLPWEHKPTYVKMDVEGWEPHALAGAAHLIKREMPVLAICLYHRSEHLWQLPNQIHAIAPGYSFYIRRYAEDCWELVCYAVPPGRKAS